jgi:ASC-1-like (ASCH) protein
MKIEKFIIRTNVNFYFLLFFCFCIHAVDVYAIYQSGEISGEVERIKYKQFVNEKLRESKLENFDINKSAGAFILSNERGKIAVSRWISPKRTRSFPYERVYDTLAFSGRKAAIIPVVKDEGLGGERDFLQWDTISLLSLLDVHLVLAYYDAAEKNPKRADQITRQKYDNNYVATRLNEIFYFNGTAREWNERETMQLKLMFEKAKLAYRRISKETKTYLHDETALNEVINYTATPQKFIEFSRRKSRQAQAREFQTDQPKEALATDTKSKITITNALFGKYFFTVDETKFEPQTIYLTEAKHSSRRKFPSRSDIKDGLIKMMLYTNLRQVKVGAKAFDYKVRIRLTSNQLKGSLDSEAKDEAIEKFFVSNSFDSADVNFFAKLFREARANKFTIILEHAETAKQTK